MNAHDQPSFLSLRDIVSPRAAKTANKHQGPHESDSLANFTPRTLQLTSLFIRSRGEFQSSARSIEDMIRKGISKRILETLPEGIVAPMRESIRRCQADPPTTWADKSLNLIGRDDLSTLVSAKDIQKESTRGHLVRLFNCVRKFCTDCSIRHQLMRPCEMSTAFATRRKMVKP